MANHLLEIAFIVAIVAIVFGARLTPRLADFIARKQYKRRNRPPASPENPRQSGEAALTNDGNTPKT